jgi:hypothetical protein
MRRNYTADEIAVMTKEQVYALPPGGLFLQFTDKELKVPTNKVIICWYFWQLYPYAGVTGIKSDHFMHDDWTGDVPKEMMSDMFWDIFLRSHGGFIPGVGLDMVWSMSRRVYQIMNELFNDTIFRMAGHVSTLDLEDLIDILDAPEVMEAKAKWAQGLIDVDEAHDQTWKVLTDGRPGMKLNEISRGARTGVFNRRQTNQTIGPRAYIPETNGEAFPSPIAPGYIEGLDSHHDRIIESRTASIAYYMAKAPLEQSEYNNRMAQFLCGVIRGVSHTDCKTKHTIPWRVSDKKDLKRLRGKFHMVNGEKVMIYGTEEELIGEKIELRSFTSCGSEDPSMPCAVCVGWNAWTTPPGTVLGHHLSTEPLARISQTILSTKHVISSTKPLFLSIDKTNAQYIYLNQDNLHEVMLKKYDKDHCDYYLRVTREDAFFINDVLNAADPDELIESRVTSCNNIQFIAAPKKEGVLPRVHDIDVSLGGRGSPLTLDMLKYMREKSWDIVGNHIEVDLSEWDWELPVIRTPRRGSDIMSVLYTFQEFVNSPTKPHVVRAIDFNKPGPAIHGLITGLSKYIGLNFTHAEVFVRALMVKLNENDEPTYELPKAGEKFAFGTMKKIILSRSQGAALAFEGQAAAITDPATYLRDGLDIPGTELDGIYMDVTA